MKKCHFVCDELCICNPYLCDLYDCENCVFYGDCQFCDKADECPYCEVIEDEK